MMNMENPKKFLSNMLIERDDYFAFDVASALIAAIDPVILSQIIETYGWNLPDEEEPEPEERYCNDLSDDAEALASAGMGTDEDYGYFGEDE